MPTRIMKRKNYENRETLEIKIIFFISFFLLIIKISFLVKTMKFRLR